MSESSSLPRANPALLLNAKYHTDPAQREFACLEAVADCLGCGDHSALMDILTDPAFEPSKKVLEAAREALPAAALLRSKMTGDDGCVFEVLEREGIPVPLKRDLGMVLLSKHETCGDAEGLMRLSVGKGSPYDVREAAGLALMRLAADGPRFSLLFELTTTSGVPYSVRKQAGLRLIDQAARHGNFPILLRLDNTNCPTDVYLELDGKADLAASVAVRGAISSRDTYMLQEIAGTEGLGESVRRLAGKAIGSFSAHDASLEPAPGGELARELMGRLGRRAGPSPKSEPPTSSRSQGPAGVIKKSSR